MLNSSQDRVKEIKSMNEFRNGPLKDKISVVDFYATWCGPCKKISPEIEKLANTYTNIFFYKVNVEEPELVDLCNNVMSIESMPTFCFFLGGRLETEVEGANLVEIIKIIKFLSGY